MKTEISLKGQHIIYDEGSQNISISDVLSQRFLSDPSVLSKNMDDLHDPYLLKDMDKAITRLKKAKENWEKVMIFGDYDVDGVTSTSLLMHLFTKLGILVSYRLPHRVHDWYGLKTKFVDEALELWVTLMITVDCGSRDKDIVADAAEKWLDIIVTDHHSVPADVPDAAIAFVNPARPDCDYPFTGLAGAWVAFKIVCALAKEYLDTLEYHKYIRESIDIAAIGTVADCMQLVWENRIIVTEGLKQIKYSRSKWIKALIEDRIDEDLDGDIFGFQIWPRLNAAGRMDTPYKAVNLILNNWNTLSDTLREIESLNELRKSQTSEFVDYALEDVNPENNIIMYSSSDISHGIIGIVAGRLTEKYFKPSIVLIDEGDKLVASCRAPEYCSIVEVLELHKEYLIAFGWHKQSAWFSILKKDFPEFQKKFTEHMNAQDFSAHRKEVSVDKVIKLDEIGFKLIQQTQKYKPFGMGNPKPLFLIKDFEIEWVKFLWKWRDHLRLTSRYGFKIFAFGMGEYYEDIRWLTSCDVICELAEDNWQGQRGIMIRVVDMII
jgi:single-stranded-DNA-specific exonuclease